MANVSFLGKCYIFNDSCYIFFAMAQKMIFCDQKNFPELKNVTSDTGKINKHHTFHDTMTQTET